MSVDHQTVLVIAVPAVLVHVAEEYKYGWVSWANGLISGVTTRQFIIINTMFVMLCITAVMSSFIIFSSSIFSLLLVNALMHIAPAVKYKRYSPGLYSAVLLFIPIGVVGYVALIKKNLLSLRELILSIILGLLWMSVPFIYQAIRIQFERES